MLWLWIIQLMINILLVGSLFIWWKDRQSRVTDDSAARLSQALEDQAQQWERDSAVYKKKTEDQLRFLVSLCERAHLILMRHGGDNSAATASSEEEELKSLRHLSSGQARNIPSVQELEVRKLTLRAEIPMDLRSLLRDQLT